MRPALLLAILVTGCVGAGEGWVTGTLYVNNCLNGQPLDRSTGDFDLHLDFFTGDPVVDAEAPAAQQRNSLTLRLQNATNNLEESDGLVLEFQNLRSIVESAAQGAPIPVTNHNLCTTPCPLAATDQVRARLYLHASCPAARVALIGSNQEMTPTASCPTGLPTGKDLEACPAPKASDKPLLDSLCAGKFNDRSAAATIDSLLGGGACIYLCQLGRAKPGGPSPDPAGFSIDFGDRVAALLAMNIIDGRAVEYRSCASASGKIRGMFAFNVARGHSAQTFP